MTLLALAAGGGSIAYVPLLTVLLPLKITALMGTEDVAALARVTFYGAIIASLANIAFGMLSDRSGTRWPWIVAGLVISSALLIAIGRAEHLAELIVLVMAWQVGLNMMLGPLFAWAGDCVPDSQKGTLGGLLAMAPAMGALAGSFVTFENLVGVEFRLETVAILVALLVLPVVIFGRRQTRPELLVPAASGDDAEAVRAGARSMVARMWLARFLVQIAEAGLFAFLLFWLRSIAANFHENTAANIFSAVLVVSVPISLMLGRWSDRAGRPLAPLVMAATASASGLAIMAVAQGLELAIVGYVLFGIAATIFLSLHTAQTLRVLPKPQHRGRDLGIFNLTNTVPSLVMPWLTLTLVPSFGFAALFALFASLAALAAGLLASTPKRP
ncbi:MFS transporter [Erythrobacter sp. JK5]|uniref:MFS transporter n=1 Tax=Erythrobacter sp. JK5 TaxID=2829500 RepID=UPI001BA63785|nr:MFS transporter [Erythrobacter sp. JK5]QUL37827.1 MFS transporter [Erythrobacter sp. JK5]